jgi:hypothetical protein
MRHASIGYHSLVTGEAPFHSDDAGLNVTPALTYCYF